MGGESLSIFWGLLDSALNGLFVSLSLLTPSPPLVKEALLILEFSSGPGDLPLEGGSSLLGDEGVFLPPV